MKAVISVVTKGRSQKQRPRFIAMAEQEPSINFAFGTTGEVDAILIGNFASMEEWGDVCDRLLDRDPPIERYTSHFVVESYASSTAIATDELEKTIDKGTR